MARFRVVVSDQVFPSVSIEREILAAIDATLEVSDGTLEGLVRLARDADGILNTYLPRPEPSSSCWWESTATDG